MNQREEAVDVKKTRRTEKTVEIHEFYAIRTASGSLPALSADCSTGGAIRQEVNN
jgi:hypothetical protein